MLKPKKVYQYSLEGKYLREFDSLNQASKATGKNFSGIRCCANGKYKFSGGYIWSFKKQKQIRVPDFAKKMPNQKKITARLNKREIEFKSIEEASIFLGCHRSNISHALNPKYKRKTVKGYSIEETL